MRAVVAAVAMSLVAPAVARQGKGPEILFVELHLPRGADTEAMAALVPMRAGQRLRRSALRRTVRLLYETQEFREVRAHVRHQPGGVVVTFVMRPRHHLADVVFLGVEAVDPSRLQRATGLEVGDEVLPDTMARARQRVLDVYETLGYRSAEVVYELREGDDGHIACVMRVKEGPRARLREISFEGSKGLPEAVLAEAIGMKPGRPLDLSELRDALRRLRLRYRESGYLRAEIGEPRVEMESTGRFGRLVVPVEAGSRTTIRVRGNRRFLDREIRELLSFPGDEPVDAQLIVDGVTAIEKRYRRLGHHRVHVAAREVPTGPGRSDLRITVAEGPVLRVRSIRFPGSEAIEAERLRAVLCDTVDAALPVEPQVVEPQIADSFGARRNPAAYEGDHRQRHRPDPCEVYDQELYEEAVTKMLDTYRARGYLSARVGPVQLEVGPGGRVGQVEVPVTEGPQTLIAEVVFVGAVEVDQETLFEVTGLEIDQPLSYLAVEDGRFAVLSLFARRGHPFADVQEDVALDTTRTRSRVTYRIESGPLVHIGRVIVRGHRNTRASTVRSRLSLHQGDVWDPERVRESQQSILEIGIYRSASVEFLDRDTPQETMDLVVEVTERRPKAIELGLGVSTEDGPRVFAEYTDLAFLAGSELTLRGKANYPVFQLSGQLTPRGPEWETRAGLRFPLLQGLRTDLVWERDSRPTYSLTRVAWSLGAGTTLLQAIAPSVRAELEFDDLRTTRRIAADEVVIPSDRRALLLEEGRTLLVSVQPALVIDLRDDPFAPRRGLLASAELDWAHDLGVGVNIHLLKASAALSWYIPATSSITFALSGRAGGVLPLSANNTTIGPKRFFFGGADTLRGFPTDSVFPEDQRAALQEQVVDCYAVLGLDELCTEDAIAVVRGARPASTGGEAFVLLKGEMRFPILGVLRGGVFLDVGNLWRDPSNVNLGALRSSAGVGLRLQTPVGPLALDLGFNLLPDPLLRESPVALHFAIGLF